MIMLQTLHDLELAGQASGGFPLAILKDFDRQCIVESEPLKSSCIDRT
jgi:hypothetical protein